MRSWLHGCLHSSQRFGSSQREDPSDPSHGCFCRPATTNVLSKCTFIQIPFISHLPHPIGTGEWCGTLILRLRFSVSLRLGYHSQTVRTQGSFFENGSTGCCTHQQFRSLYSLLLGQSVTRPNMSRRAAPNAAAERAAQNQQTIKTLLKLEGNKTCADCKRNKRK